MDYDDGKVRRRFMMDATNNHASTMHVPVICLDDDDDDDDDLKIDKDYKIFMDHLIDDNNLGPIFELNSRRPIRYEFHNGESETRKFDMFSIESKRSEVKNKYPMNCRVSEERKRNTVGFKAEISRASSSLGIDRENIQRDNRAAERRKRKIVLLAREQDNIQGGRRMSESNVESLRDVPIVIAQESIQGDNTVRKIADLKAESSRRVVPLVRDQEDIQRVNNVKVNSLSHVPLVRDHEGTHRVNNVKVKTLGRDQEGIHRVKFVPVVRDREDILKVPEGRKTRLSETIRSDVPLVRAEKATQRDKKITKTDEFYVYTLSGVRLVRRKQQVIQQDDKVSEGRKSKFSELEPEMLRKNVPLVRAEEKIQQDKVISKRGKKDIVETNAARTSKVVPVELKAVSETSRIVQENQRKKIVQNDPADLNPPVPEKDLLVNVKVEQDLESWSDDSDIIAVSDSPFSDGEVTPFVVSKSVVDLEKESKDDESKCCLFTKELMDVLKKPYNEKELLNLSKEASMQKPVTRCRELRKGREKFYATDQMGLSYLQKFSDFNEEYKLVDGVDKVKALKLLRGFFFYLRNCSRDGAFKPWSTDI